MQVTQFATVGKSVIIRACGLAANNKQTNVLDQKKSGCFSCPHYASIMQAKNDTDKISEITKQNCDKCTHKVYKTVYVNEKNRYGYAPSLKSYALQTFLFLHFCGPSEVGIISDFSIKKAAANLQCTQKTIHAALKKLQDTGYITYSAGSSRGCYHVLLQDYKNYYASANKGGRGYITMPLCFLQQLGSFNSLNMIRIFLREYLNIDAQKTSGIYIDKKSYKQLLAYLPYYCRPKHLDIYLQSSNPIYDILCSNNNVVFELRPEYIGDVQKDIFINECKNRIKQQIAQDNLLIENLNSHTSITDLPTWLAEVGEKCLDFNLPIVLTNKDLEDCAKLCWQYSFSQVIHAIHQTYIHYPAHSSLKNYGGMIRVLIEDQPYATA